MEHGMRLHFFTSLSFECLIWRLHFGNSKSGEKKTKTGINFLLNVFNASSFWSQL